MQIAHEETWIRERAYAIWEQEGRPAGRERQHWHQAACEIGDGAVTNGSFAQAGVALKSVSARRRTAKPRKADA